MLLGIVLDLTLVLLLYVMWPTIEDAINLAYIEATMAPDELEFLKGLGRE